MCNNNEDVGRFNATVLAILDRLKDRLEDEEEELDPDEKDPDFPEDDE